MGTTGRAEPAPPLPRSRTPDRWRCSRCSPSAGRGRWSCTSAMRSRATPATTTAFSGTSGGCATCSRRRGCRTFTPATSSTRSGRRSRTIRTRALPALVAATVLKPLSIVAAQNLLLLAYLFANMAAMYALAWTIVDSPSNAGVRRRAAILAAVIFGLSPYVAVHLLGHFDLVAAWVLPAFALALHARCTAGPTARRSRPASFSPPPPTSPTTTSSISASSRSCTCWRGRSGVGGARRRAGAAARGAAATSFCAARCCSPCCGIAIVVNGGRSFTSERHRHLGPHAPERADAVLDLRVRMDGAHLAAAAARGRWARRIRDAARGAVIVAIVVAAFVVGRGAAVLEAAYLIARGEYVTPYYGWRSAPRGIDVVAPLLGHPLHPLFARRQRACLRGRVRQTTSRRSRGSASCRWCSGSSRAATAPARTRRRLWRIVGARVSASGRWDHSSSSADSTPASSCRRSSRGSCRSWPTRGCRGARWSVVFMALAVLIGIGMSARDRTAACVRRSNGSSSPSSRSSTGMRRFA